MSRGRLTYVQEEKIILFLRDWIKVDFIQLAIKA